MIRVSVCRNDVESIESWMKIKGVNREFFRIAFYLTDFGASVSDTEVKLVDDALTEVDLLEFILRFKA